MFKNTSFREGSKWWARDSNGESVDTSAVTMEPADIIPPTVRQNITLFAGAGGQSKFGRLYYKLHKKYAAAIKHVAKV